MDKNKGSSRVYIVTAVMVVIALIIMVVLLSVVTNATKKKRYVDTESPTQKTKDIPVIVTNFSAPLSVIIGDLDFYGNYDYEVRYSGAKFNFKCIDYDDEIGICNSGTAMMNVGTTHVELYTYDNPDNNYQNNSGDYYIIVDDNYVILTQDGITSSGKSLVSSRNGEKIMEVDNVITKYQVGEDIYKSLYPSVEKDTFNFYLCSASKVKIASVDIKNNGKVEILQDIDDGICN